MHKQSDIRVMFAQAQYLEHILGCFTFVFERHVVFFQGFEICIVKCRQLFVQDHPSNLVKMGFKFLGNLDQNFLLQERKIMPVFALSVAVSFRN